MVKALLLRDVKLKGMAHITGGGLPENLPRCIPKGLQASIDIQTWQKPEIFKWLQKAGDIPESDLWNTFNLGVGFCLVVSVEAADAAIQVCRDNGLDAWIMGRIEDSPVDERKGILGLPFEQD